MNVDLESLSITSKLAATSLDRKVGPPKSTTERMDKSAAATASTVAAAGSSHGKDKRCHVCGDRALGYNFSAVSCESCKAFFRRNAFKVHVHYFLSHVSMQSVILF